MMGRGALVALLIATASPAFAGDLVLIVHADQDARLTLGEVAQIYLKTRRYWDNGKPIVPVNRNSGSTARDSFVRTVFGESARQLVVYWNRQYFRGVLPPATLASDEAVKRFVAGERLAIGYVHPSVVDDSVRVVLRMNDERTGVRQPTPSVSDGQ